MSLPDSIVFELSRGVARPFADWPDPTVPVFGAGVYTIWDNDGRFIYVGMSGRGITAETVRRNSPLGIYTRLHSHASGRRSGDQFCVYVADRLVLPTLSQEDISAIGSGRHQMDAFVRRYIHENLCFRFVMLPDGAAAYIVESAIKNGDWEHGLPPAQSGKVTEALSFEHLSGFLQNRTRTSHIYQPVMTRSCPVGHGLGPRRSCQAAMSAAFRSWT